MKKETKNIIRKVIYGILFIAMIAAFIYLSEKYASNSDPKILTINDYYSDIDSDRFEVIRGQKFISLIKTGKNIIFIGSGTSEYSKKYIEMLNEVLEENKIEKIYYYDINNDKSQKNSNYYTIRELLNGSLSTTDGSTNNLLAPSFYIIENGEVKYYNIDTVVMKNTDTVDSYWTEEKISDFKQELASAIQKYYLN